MIFARRLTFLSLGVLPALGVLVAAPPAPDPATADPAAAASHPATVPPQATATSFEARPAGDFLDSVGVCGHFGRIGTNYVTRFAELKPLILDLGIRHLRTNPVLHPAAVRNVRELGDAGVKFLFSAHPDRYGLPTGADAAGLPPALLATTHDDLAYVGAFLAHLKANFAGCTEMIEGLNEPYPNIDHARDWMRELRRLTKAGPVLARLPLLGSAVAVPSVQGDKSGEWIALSDYGNVHAYPSGRPPESTITERIASVFPQYGYLRYLVTETGYHGGMNNPPNKNEPTSESARAVYLPRLFLEHFRLGIVRSYKYQLIDDRTEDQSDGVYPRQLPRESHFGLIDYNLRPKPVYFALKNLLAILRDDPAAPVEPAALAYTLSGASDLRHVLLRKSTGEFYLAIWRTVAVWDPVARRDVPVEVTPVTVKFGTSFKSVRLFRPTESAEPLDTLHNTDHLTLPLDGRVVMLALSAP